MPYLNGDFIEYLAGLTGKHDVIVPELAEGYQPLHAVYSRNCLPSIKRLLMLNKLKITGFYREICGETQRACRYTLHAEDDVRPVARH